MPSDTATKDFLDLTNPDFGEEDPKTPLKAKVGKKKPTMPSKSALKRQKKKKKKEEEEFKRAEEERKKKEAFNGNLDGLVLNQ